MCKRVHSLIAMGANNHPTTQPESHELPMETKQQNLIGDLQELDVVTSAEKAGTGQNVVLFECEGPMPGDVPSDVLRVLADHSAMIPREEPDTLNEHLTYIEL